METPNCYLSSLKILWIMVLLLTQNLISIPAQGFQFNVENQLNKAVKEHQLKFPILTQKIYRDRNYQSIWFNINGKTPLIWDAVNLLKAAPQYGLNPTNYHCNQLSINTINNAIQIPINDDVKPIIDVLITDAMLAFTAHLRYGTINPSTPLLAIDKETFKGFKVDSVLEVAIKNPNFKNTILSAQPNYLGYKTLQQQLENLVKNQTGDCVGITDHHIQLFFANMERWRWLSPVKQPYIIINIPAFNLTYYDGITEQNFKVIIGKSNTKTPVLSSKIRFFTTAPDWTVPRSILVKELLPSAIKNNSYMANNNFNIYDKYGNYIPATHNNLLKVRANPSEYTVKQSPGPDNALGQIVFNFDNSYAVYLHDTPNRSFFDKSERALSHGCIRVENPDKLVEFFLKNDQATEILPEVLNAMEKYKRKRVYLKKPIPITVTYLTMEVKNGELQTYKDLYQKDKNLIKALKLN
ncbi:L,D-transpeptidase scaffold domain-containing protein [Pedobacter cryophilus]|uniref:L,D-TPase catalytic domain-containing protein n=1 Tax=Pedobacter cryophilus TaxID=2571271 RepID=A0A4U1C376_9SPHI|nr:L,D-transpeptidase family protein [Pedobacter cryophilus]TKB97644.1 hypothetical protein FA046_09755 [Pedobacter cryophilus]